MDLAEGHLSGGNEEGGKSCSFTFPAGQPGDWTCNLLIISKLKKKAPHTLKKQMVNAAKVRLEKQQ